MKLNPLSAIGTFVFFLTVTTQITSTAQTVPDSCADIDKERAESWRQSALGRC